MFIMQLYVYHVLDVSYAMISFGRDDLIVHIMHRMVDILVTIVWITVALILLILLYSDNSNGISILYDGMPFII